MLSSIDHSDDVWSYLLFGLPAFRQTGCVLPYGLLSPEFSAHLQVAGAHDQERDAVGEHKVGDIVAESIYRNINQGIKRESFICTHRKSIFEYPCLPSDHTTIQTVGDELLEKHFQTNKSQKKWICRLRVEIYIEFLINIHFQFKCWQPLWISRLVKEKDWK